jgi:hypothetical protein
MVESAGDDRWSNFSAHGLGKSDERLDAFPEYENLARTPATRRRGWSAFVPTTPWDEELAAIRRLCSTGLPFRAAAWVEGLATRLGLGLDLDLDHPPPRPASQDTAYHRPVRILVRQPSSGISVRARFRDNR